ncbi:hypothetical protein SC1_01961 [Sphingopyxis sp. C-1]|nr:hypothetical protein SC1_01961 [Sphingopyxis sp. C-1]
MDILILLQRPAELFLHHKAVLKHPIRARPKLFGVWGPWSNLDDFVAVSSIAH